MFFFIFVVGYAKADMEILPSPSPVADQGSVCTCYYSSSARERAAALFTRKERDPNSRRIIGYTNYGSSRNIINDGCNTSGYLMPYFTYQPTNPGWYHVVATYECRAAGDSLLDYMSGSYVLYGLTEAQCTSQAAAYTLTGYRNGQLVSVPSVWIGRQLAAPARGHEISSIRRPVIAEQVTAICDYSN